MEYISVLYLEITENFQFRVIGVYLFIFYEISANDGLQPMLSVECDKCSKLAILFVNLLAELTCSSK